MSNPYHFKVTEPAVARRHHRRNRGSDGIPWQLWVVIAFLGLEGLGNLLAVPAMPVAAVWLATKILLITGLICRWRIVFVLHIALGLLHVLAFALEAPFVGFLNLLLVGLVASQVRRFFPSNPPMHRAFGAEKA